jgi:hypothetical protein
MYRSRTAAALVAGTLGLALAACASSSFRTAWKAPNVQPLSIQPGEKVVGLIVSANEATRTEAETKLAAELDARGVQGVAGHTLVPADERLEEKKVKSAIKKSGAAAVVVMKVVDTPRGDAPAAEKEPWDNWNWGPAFNAQTPVAGILFVETRLYDLAKGELVWVGQSQIVSPSNVDRVIQQLVTQADNEMRKQGVIAGG